jgi:hypothetical protein
MTIPLNKVIFSRKSTNNGLMDNMFLNFCFCGVSERPFLLEEIHVIVFFMNDKAKNAILKKQNKWQFELILFYYLICLITYRNRNNGLRANLYK